MRVERLVEPLGPVAEAVDGEHERVVERLEHRHGGTERDHREQQRASRGAQARSTAKASAPAARAGCGAGAISARPTRAVSTSGR